MMSLKCLEEESLYLELALNIWLQDHKLFFVVLEEEEFAVLLRYNWLKDNFEVEIIGKGTLVDEVSIPVEY